MQEAVERLLGGSLKNYGSRKNLSAKFKKKPVMIVRLSLGFQLENLKPHCSVYQIMILLCSRKIS